MTALKQYERLEALGIWRDSADAQRREVICSFGDATLVIFDGRSNRPLAHWSLAALVRRNPGKVPAIYAPAEEPGEDLEIEDRDMVAAINKLQAALEAGRPHPGRLRGILVWGVVALAGVAILWELPSALVEQTARVTPADHSTPSLATEALTTPASASNQSRQSPGAKPWNGSSTSAVASAVSTAMGQRYRNRRSRRLALMIRDFSGTRQPIARSRSRRPSSTKSRAAGQAFCTRPSGRCSGRSIRPRARRRSRRRRPRSPSRSGAS